MFNTDLISSLFPLLSRESVHRC